MDVRGMDTSCCPLERLLESCELGKGQALQCSPVGGDIWGIIGR